MPEDELCGRVFKPCERELVPTVPLPDDDAVVASCRGGVTTTLRFAVSFDCATASVSTFGPGEKAVPDSAAGGAVNGSAQRSRSSGESVASWTPRSTRREDSLGNGSLDCDAESSGNAVSEGAADGVPNTRAPEARLATNRGSAKSRMPKATRRRS